MVMNAPQPPEGACLIPINLEDATEGKTLLDQRKLCGWNFDKIPSWKESAARGERTMFWITLPCSDLTIGVAPLQRNESVIPVGHVSLDKVDSPEKDILADTTLAKADGSLLTITSLFVLPQFSAQKLGGFAMDTCERLAREEPYGSPECEAVTLTTLSSRYLRDGVEGIDGKGRWAMLGQDMPVRDNMPWYARRGYVAYKEQIRYSSLKPDGSTIYWYAVFMRKELGNGETQP